MEEQPTTRCTRRAEVEERHGVTLVKQGSQWTALREGRRYCAYYRTIDELDSVLTSLLARERTS